MADKSLTGNRDSRALLSEFKFKSNYAKYNDELERLENWDESVDRVFDEMHGIKYQKELEKSPKLRELYEFARKKYKEQYVLGSQRALQFGGQPILKHNAKMYNCLSTYADRAKFFQETMYWLLCGCGVGFSVQKHHVAKLPSIKKRSNRSKVYTIEDSIEGWSDAIGVLLSSYLTDGAPFPKYQGCHVSFDYSKIRPKGSMISGGFKAPGHEGLRASILKIEELIEKELNDENFNGKMRPIVAYDIVMHMSDAVLSGGVRRSATICLFSHDDQEMLNAKTGKWFEENPQRARSNNSVLIKKDSIAKEQFAEIMKSVKQFGEPGFVFTEDLEIVYNPCVEIGMFPQLNDISGFQGCVSYETKLITKNGIETIGNVVDEDRYIDIWNGEEWCNLKPFKTGSNRELYRVTFTDGSYLDVTDNHKFLIKNRFQKEFNEVETKDLIELHKTSKYGLQIPRANVVYDENLGVETKYAYEYGFILGDGSCPKYNNHTQPYRTPFAELYENSKDYSLPLKGKFGKESINENDVKFKRIYFDDVDKEFSFDLKYNIGLPKEIFSWNKKSIIDFIAGWIDSDGSETVNGVRIYGREDKLRDLQLLLTKIGVDSSVNLMSKKGTKTNFATRKNDVWYIQISDTKDLYSNRIKLISKPVKYKGKNQLIKSIKKLDGLHDSYCFEEPKLHNGLFNNVLTKQCNLTEINGGACTTEELFYEACIAAAIIGTLQAGYTDFRYVDEISKAIFEREALLGCSITGFMSNPDILLNPEIQKRGAEIIVETNEIVAKLIGINPAARTTCVKPSGNASVLLKTASGIHGEEAPMYFRNVQVNKDEDLGKFIYENVPNMVEDSVWSANNTDWVISFPIKTNNNSIFKEDLYGVELLNYVKLTQQNWVEAGTVVERCAIPSVRHNVSNTVVVDDWDEVEEYIYENRHWFAGISLLPMTGANDYAQAPFTAVYDSQDLLDKYGEATIFASGLIVDGLNAFNNNLWKACDTVLGLGEKLDYSEEEVELIIDTTNTEELWSNLGFKNGTLSTLTNLDIKPEVEEYKRYLDSKLPNTVHNYILKKDWIRRAKQFAKRYFTSVKEMTYCLKDVNNYHRWMEIERELPNLDFDKFNQKPEYIDIDTTGAVACSGVQCEVTF